MLEANCTNNLGIITNMDETGLFAQNPVFVICDACEYATAANDSNWSPSTLTLVTLRGRERFQ